MLLIVGPCSIHDPEAALEYAVRLNELRKRYADRLCIVMRVYLEKPRSLLGWKGLVNDPHLDGSCDIAAGLRIGRRLMLDIAEMGMPVATEFLDPLLSHYYSDLVSWAAIGARTTGSPIHRHMASGLAMPLGFKNGLEGSAQIAVDAIQAARHEHAMLGVDQDGRISMVRTYGNLDGHLVLRGGRNGPNYDTASVETAAELMRGAGLEPSIIIDCSHSNCGKDHARQAVALDEVLRHRTVGRRAVVGLMLEGNLNEGCQPLPVDPASLRYGVSITDPCIGWEETARLVRRSHAASPPREAADSCGFSVAGTGKLRQEGVYCIDVPIPNLRM